MAMSVHVLSFVFTPGFLLAFVTTFLVIITVRQNWRGTRFPPGPFSLPVIGSILSLAGTGDKRQKFLDLSKQYGDVFTLDMGVTRMVILASYDAIKEALVKNADALAARPLDLYMFNEVTKGKGIGATHGPFWREQRKFIHGVFREFGVGRPVFQEKIQEEIGHFLQVLREKACQPYDIAQLFHSAVSNVINNVIYGRRYPYGDPLFLKHIYFGQVHVSVVGSGGLLNLWPFLKYLPGDLFKFKRLDAITNEFQSDIAEIIKQHRDSRTPGVTRDVIDAYLEEMERQKDNPNTTFTEEQLGFIVWELFTAGAETAANTLRWAVLYLLHYPEVYQCVQQEVDKVVGPSRMPSVTDKPSMPYTEAVICEVQRMGDIVPLGVPHACHSDVTLRGYSLPAGTVVLPILHAAHRDPKVWPEPNRFNPERFLDEGGNLCKNEHLIPFSMGRRVCLGESLARMELFLFFTSLIQHFRFRLPTGNPLPELTGDLGLTYLPRPFDIVLEQK